MLISKLVTGVKLVDRTQMMPDQVPCWKTTVLFSNIVYIELNKEYLGTRDLVW